jgi:hypothetical protein
MCFSATASFAAAAGLVPLGAAAVGLCRRRDRDELLPLAELPLFFAAQQAIEGLVWLGLADDAPAAAAPRLAALAYLFFAFAFWPGWIPFLALRLWRGSAGWRQRSLLLLQALGLVLALLLWLPLALQPERVAPAVLDGSIDYGTTLLLNGGLLVYGRYLYAAVIGLPLLLLPSARLRGFGIALLASGAAADWFYRQTFASVWCYFSAVLSALCIWIVWAETADQATSRSLSAADSAEG